MKDNSDRKKIIFNKYQPIKLIHSSGFGDVYEGKNIKENIPVAIKVERKNSKFNILESEAFFLMNLKGFGIPKIITYGHYFKYNVLIEELLGKSIENIYDIKKYDNFSIKDVCMIALQSLDRLEYIHSKFIIHRDIKPQNFVIGRNDPDVIYLIDFGLSRKYRSSRTNKHIKFKNLKLTYGSLRYLSINGNCGYEQSRRDDLESLGYMLIYLSTGTLPWILFESENIDVVKKYLRTHKLKKKLTAEKLCEDLPEEMAQYINYCRKLLFEEDPNYKFLRSLFENILINIQQKNDLKFSWIPEILYRNTKENRRNESKNKTVEERSASPHMRIYNNIKNNIEKIRSSKSLNKIKQNVNIGFISFTEKPIHFLYNNKEKTKDNMNVNNERENSMSDGEEKKYKIKKKIDSESTREKDIKGLNTDKSLSTSCDKLYVRNFKKNKKVFIYIDYKTNFNEEKNIKQESKEKNKIIIADDEEKKAFQDKYKGVLNKNHKTNNSIKEKKDNMETVEKKFHQNKKKRKVEKDKNIKFISNNNFWDVDIIDDISDEHYKFDTYNNFDLNYFDINNYHLNQTINNRIIKKVNLNQNEKRKMNNNFTINKQNYYYRNNSIFGDMMGTNRKQKIIQNKKKGLISKSSKSQKNDNKNIIKSQLNNKNIYQNLNENYFQERKNEFMITREDKNNYNISNNLLNQAIPSFQNRDNKIMTNNLRTNIFCERKINNANNNAKIQNNFFNDNI